MSSNKVNTWPVEAGLLHPMTLQVLPMNSGLRQLLSRPAAPVRVEGGVDYDGFRDGWNAYARYMQRHPDTVLPKIERVIFHNPATIIYWNDGTKTVVKCQPGDTFSTETGLMAAMLKRFLGNDNTYNKVINHWLDAAK